MKHKMKSFGLLFFLGMISCTSNAGEVNGDLRTVLDAQINNSVIDIPKGTYILDLKDGKQPYLFSYKKMFRSREMVRQLFVIIRNRLLVLSIVKIWSFLI